MTSTSHFSAAKLGSRNLGRPLSCWIDDSSSVMTGSTVLPRIPAFLTGTSVNASFPFRGKRVAQGRPTSAV